MQDSENITVEQSKRWYQRPGWIIVFLIFFFPVGLYLMWRHAPWGTPVKGTVTGVVALLVVFAAIDDANTAEPQLTVTEPSEATQVTSPTFTVRGSVEPAEAEVLVNGEPVTTTSDGSFDTVVDLEEGENEVNVTAINGSKQDEFARVVTRELSEQERAEQEAAAEPEPEPAPEPEPEPAPEPEPEPEAELAPEPITLSGTGQQATSPFELESGLAIFRLTHQGQANFIVDLLDESGASVAPMGLVNEIGPFDGSYAQQVTAGQHILEIMADGPWTATIEQPRPTSAPETRSFEGTGKTATEFFELSSGLHTVTLTHQGDANFIVDILNRDGASVEPMGLANEIGPFEGSSAVTIPEDGVYLFQVEANGPWTISVE